MTDGTSPHGRFSTLDVVADRLAITPGEVLILIRDGRLRGVPVGSPPRWRVDLDSLEDYLDDQAEITRRAALWHQSQEASFPDLWGRGAVRHED